MSRCHTRGFQGCKIRPPWQRDRDQGRDFLTFSLFTYNFARFGRFACFARFARFACFGRFGGFVSLVSVVSSRCFGF